ncbi:uncharacterized protein EV420DRAFT_1504583 [Desarmillaria tabescens]|uniref:F-box domain-containing protein n=1 Tax=Armillaria tabescens TaxID=1929756 RepID=A0AA39NMM5_ARMTA|nr:uncharacterized protein EV420DRAFT_1504583 [Desarmillaria tabescens]KAK0468460.1 hypothetical protein EV420DRAFT_1504583 [Desarmillaria tabescens]
MEKSLLLLPPEVLLSILSILDFKTLIRCRQICRKALEIIDSSALLQYKIHLGMNCLEDNNSGHSSQELLEKVQQHRYAWQSFRYSELLLLPCAGNAWELIGNILAIHVPGVGFTFNQIPSALRGVQKICWTVKSAKIGVEVEDFSMDRSQDLLVVLQAKRSLDDCLFPVHILTMSGDKHPLAHRHVLEDVKLENSEMIYDIRIFGDLLGVLFTAIQGDISILVIWNWKTGRIKKHVTGTMLELQTFIILTEDILMIGSLQINGEPSPNLRVYRLDEEDYVGSDVLDTMTFVCALTFPLPKDGVEVEIRLFSDPPPAKPNQNDGLFMTCHDDRLLVIGYDAYVSDTETEYYSSFVPLSSLMAMVERCLATTNSKGTIIPHSEWAHHTEVTTSLLSDVWISVVHGMRAITHEIDGTLIRARILDFNQYAIRNDLEEGRARTNSYEIVGAETPAVRVNGKFLKDGDGYINSSLKQPYRVVSRDLPKSIRKNVTDLMLTEDSVVMVLREVESETFGILSF